MAKRFKGNGQYKLRKGRKGKKRYHKDYRTPTKPRKRKLTVLEKKRNRIARLGVKQDSSDIDRWEVVFTPLKGRTVISSQEITKALERYGYHKPQTYLRKQFMDFLVKNKGLKKTYQHGFYELGKNG